MIESPIHVGKPVTPGAAVLLFAVIHLTTGTGLGAEQSSDFIGSVSCRECHERFYKLWAPSRHGTAMQTFTAKFAREQLTPQRDAITVEGCTYRVEIAGDTGWVLEDGPKGKGKYRIDHAMGGKNVYYFLTPLERGRLQVLPVAYDVPKKQWINATASMVRHVADEAVEWRDPLLTFNTSCHGCHVSQLSTNYDPKTDSYHTTWAEPGINCETCHGPGDEHVRVCRAASKGQTPKDLKILSYKQFTVDQTNTTCAPCHAKGRPLTTAFKPGERFFDHYDLVTFEDRDFHPDGRDLGENYTYTSWLTSPCARSSKLRCIHCHTSSGRYRFKGKKANDACLPCHAERVANATAHTHHKPDSKGNECIGCHMPMTSFARMGRSDHSMLPPTPAATIQFKSPNACNICHDDEDAKWADKHVREWHQEDYQAPVLHRAKLIADARKRDWSRLDAMLSRVTGKDRDEVFATSLIRLLTPCEDKRKWPVLLKTLKDPSPLVRSAAAVGLSGYLATEGREALLDATEDEYRLVRIRAAATLAPHPRRSLNADDRQRLARATEELEESLRCRPDDWASHYNMANHHSDRGRPQEALKSYQIASRLRPDVVLPYVNVSMVHARLGQSAEAERSLRKAIEVEPNSAEANFNLGLLMAEQGKTREAEGCLRRALKADPTLDQAAYNLGVLLAKRRSREGIKWCRKAHELRPNDPKYAYTLAFYLEQGGQLNEAASVLRDIVRQAPTHVHAYTLLADIYEKQGKVRDAMSVYRWALGNERLPTRERQRVAAKLRALSAR